MTRKKKPTTQELVDELFHLTLLRTVEALRQPEVTAATLTASQKLLVELGYPLKERAKVPKVDQKVSMGSAAALDTDTITFEPDEFDLRDPVLPGGRAFDPTDQ